MESLLLRYLSRRFVINPFTFVGTVLIVDSYSVMRAALRDALQNGGYLVVTAGELGSAVDRLSEVEPDLLIIPPYINGMPGHLAADYLRSRHPGLPVLILGGLIEDERIATENTIREFHTYPKPFSREELLGEIGRILKYESERKHAAEGGRAA
jgi:DNA-binding NtrC family response regulator